MMASPTFALKSTCEHPNPRQLTATGHALVGSGDP